MTAEPHTSAGAATSGPREELIAVDGLVKHFPIRAGLRKRQVAAVQAVDGLRFSVRRGETFSLVGDSGCGKSTTGRLLTRLLEPTAGRSILEGRDITRLPEGALRPLRKNIQMIFQDPYSSLNPRLPVFDIVAEPLIIHRVVTGEDELRKRVRELVELVGINPENNNR